MILTLFFVTYLLGNAIAILHSYHEAGSWSWKNKLALGIGLYLAGLATVNAVLIALPRILYDSFPTLGPNWPTVVGGMLAGTWLVLVLHPTYRWMYRKMGGVADAV